MIRYITVAGTHGADRTDWDQLDSPFSNLLQFHGCEQLITDPLRKFMWSTEVDGLLGRNNTWDASGQALADYIVPPLLGSTLLAAKDTYVISHSHGGNVVAYACGKYGLKIEGLITIGMPIREDLHDLYQMATPNIKRHLHIHAGWKDYWQVLGALRDGRWGIHREHPFATNVKTSGGHGTVLRDVKHFHKWVDEGWLEFWKTGKPLPN